MSRNSFSPAELEDAIGAHLTTRTDARELSQHFRREGYVKLSGLIPDTIFKTVSEEVHRVLDIHAKRIDVELKATSNSPRYMSTVGQKAIAESSDLIPAIYDCRALTDFLTQLAAEPVVPCPWEDEKYIITRQHKRGDTHGWHWGDFSFTLIWIIEAPALEYGGMLQCVPHTNWDKQDPRVHEYLIDNPIRTYGHATGDMYFLRSNTTLHRTVPLSEDKTRIILNTCWGSQDEQSKTQTHETMEAICPT